jgi:acetyltransferase
VQIGRDEKLERISAHILPDNQVMIHVCKEAGFKLEREADNQGFTAEYVL